MRDLAAVNRWIEDFERKQSRMYAAADLESASITNGRLRFIGGTLRVDSGGRVEIVGALQIDGTTTVTGQFNMTGDFEVSGPWKFTGPGEITGDFSISGDVTITGKVTQVGDMDVQGVFTLEGNGWSITGNGEISGDVDITGDVEMAGNMDVTGDVKTRDGGRIIVSGDAGDTVLSNSKMRFANGSEVASYGNGGAALTSPDLILISGQGGIGLQGLDTYTAAQTGMVVNTLGITPLGRVFRVVN